MQPEDGFFPESVAQPLETATGNFLRQQEQALRVLAFQDAFDQAPKRTFDDPLSLIKNSAFDIQLTSGLSAARLWQGQPNCSPSWNLYLPTQAEISSLDISNPYDTYPHPAAPDAHVVSVMLRLQTKEQSCYIMALGLRPADTELTTPLSEAEIQNLVPAYIIPGAFKPYALASAGNFAAVPPAKAEGLLNTELQRFVNANRPQAS